MRRSFIFILVFLLTFGGGLAFAEGQAEGDSDEVSIGLAVSTLSNPFFVDLADGAEEAAEEMGVELIVVDSEDDSANEANNMQDLIQQQVDVLLVNPTDAEAIVPSVQQANSQDIPVITLDRSADGGEIVSHIASDNVAGGEMAAEHLVELIGGEGNVVELQGIPGASAARERGEGFNNVISEEDSIEVVAQQTANFERGEGLNVFQNVLQSTDDIDGVFAHNDEMVLGAIEAAESAGVIDDMVFVGFDAIDDAVAAVEEGTLDATVAQQPAEIGRLGVEAAVEYLDTGDIEDNIPVELTLVTPDNVDDF